MTNFEKFTFFIKNSLTFIKTKLRAEMLTRKFLFFCFGFVKKKQSSTISVLRKKNLSRKS